MMDTVMAPQRGSGSIAVPPVVASLEPLFRPLSGLATLKELKLLADLRRTSAGDSLGQLGGRALREQWAREQKIWVTFVCTSGSLGSARDTNGRVWCVGFLARLARQSLCLFRTWENNGEKEALASF